MTFSECFSFLKDLFPRSLWCAAQLLRGSGGPHPSRGEASYNFVAPNLSEKSKNLPIPRPHSRPINSESLEMGTRHSYYFKKFSVDSRVRWRLRTSTLCSVALDDHAIASSSVQLPALMTASTVCSLPALPRQPLECCWAAQMFDMSIILTQVWGSFVVGFDG